MRLSKGLWQTFKEIPNDAEIASHILMIRAGLIQKSAAGIYYYLPVFLRSIQKMQKIIKSEMDKAGAYELQCPIATPAELWEESGRLESFPDMLKAKDRLKRILCFSPTNEEAMVDVFRSSVKSYKQLPLCLYQINTKFRDELRPRYGLMRCREFLMKDAYSFHMDAASLRETYNRIYKAYENMFKRAGLEFIAVNADAGSMASAGAMTHEFQVLAKSGEDVVVRCIKCGKAANIEKAQTYRKVKEYLKDKTLHEVLTENKETIEDVSSFLKLSQENCLKSLVYSVIHGDKESFVLALLLGDDVLNEIKLKNYLKADHVLPATEKQIEELGLIKGYIGPYKLESKNLKVIYDLSVNLKEAYCTGAQKKDTHVLGFIPERDSKNYEVADLRLSRAGDFCLECTDGEIEQIRGIEVGHIFELGDKYTRSMNVTVLDHQGKGHHPLMGCYGVGVPRTIAAAIEQHHDENGIIWPVSIAPYELSLLIIGKDMKEIAEKVYEDLIQNEFEVLFDDRDAGPGFKFKDADLLGLPLQVIIGDREYKNSGLFEIKVRKTGVKIKVSPADLISKIKELLLELSK